MNKPQTVNTNQIEKRFNHQLTTPTTPPSSGNPHTAVQSKNKELIMSFSQDIYPFLNQDHSSFSFFKTAVSLAIANDKLDKLIKLSHPNIISLRKIVKSRTKQSGLPNVESCYSFYYQKVQHGISMISEDIQKLSKFSNIILSLDLPKIISSVTSYLDSQKICYAVRKQDIGINREGIVKIYIPPSFILDEQPPQNVNSSFWEIVQWWKTVQDKCHLQIFRKDNQLSTIKLSNKRGLKFHNPKITQSFINQDPKQDINNNDDKIAPKNQLKLKKSINSHMQQLAKLGQLQLKKINKIDSQVKLIRQKLLQQSKQHNTSYFKAIPKLQPQKQSQSLFRNNFSTENLNLKQTRQIVQQNINCINIYNRPVSHLLRSNSYQYNPLHYPSPHADYFDRHYYNHMNDSQDQQSQDTYDIQFETQCQLPKNTTQNILRNTLFQRFDNSSNQHSNLQNGLHEQQGPSIKQVKNQLFDPRKLTESAGPLQFKNIISKCTTPRAQTKQFKADSEENQKLHHSNSKLDRILLLLKNSTGSSNNLSKSFGYKLSGINIAQQRIETDAKRMATSDQFSNNYRRNSDRRPHQIESKIKKVLEKTKNTIVLLNGAKDIREKAQKLLASKPK